MLKMKLLFLIALSAFLLLQIDAQTMTDELRLLVLNAHNNLRSKVAQGQAKNKDGKKLPKAGNMNKLTYSLTVESFAQEVANSCYFDSKYVNTTFTNLWASAHTTSNYLSPSKALSNSVPSWFSELKKYGLKKLAMDEHPKFNHFTQLSWADTKEIGCAVHNCPVLNGPAKLNQQFKWTFVVCNYSPPGNIQEAYIYKSSKKVGSNCPAEAPVNNKGLCQDPNVTDIHAYENSRQIIVS
ncbi:(pine wood nematode) hypothetical protein [Aphelenchoides bicaudatus]|nr:(pine wood nematode) hypothetical protein [Aphelenchoides bicaudatus]